ncbi:MAG: antibiotic biosynthesis monooxygenase [Candidatus Obscuribacterales bacterium]|nr:antibiotic biosynthesis monooxygenase [Candidatus Obscuribacterales bacterium]
MFVSINHIMVKRGREADFEKRFLARDRAVEDQPGFVSIDILKPGMKSIRGSAPEPLEHNEYQVMTRWENEEAFRSWVKSDSFKQSHSGEIDKTMFDGQSYLTYHQTIVGAGFQKPVGVGA